MHWWKFHVIEKWNVLHIFIYFFVLLYIYLLSLSFKKSMKWQLLWECFQTLLYDKLSKFCPWNVTTVMCHIFDFTWKLMCMFQNIFAYNSYKSHFWLFLFILQQRKNQNRKNLLNFNKYLPRSCLFKVKNMAHAWTVMYTKWEMKSWSRKKNCTDEVFKILHSFKTIINNLYQVYKSHKKHYSFQDLKMLYEKMSHNIIIHV